MSIATRIFQVTSGPLLDDVRVIMSERERMEIALRDLAAKVDAVSAHVDEVNGMFIGFRFESEPNRLSFMPNKDYWLPNVNAKAGQRVAKMIANLPAFPILNRALANTPLNPYRSWVVDNETGQRYRAQVVVEGASRVLVKVPQKLTSFIGGDARFGDLEAETNILEWQAPDGWQELKEPSHVSSSAEVAVA